MMQLALGTVYINVMSVENSLVTCVTSRDILLILMLVKSLSSVAIVRNPSLRKLPWFNMKHFTLEKVCINVTNVEKVFVVCVTLRDILLLTLVKNLSSVDIVKNPSREQVV